MATFESCILADFWLISGHFVFANTFRFLRYLSLVGKAYICVPCKLGVEIPPSMIKVSGSNFPRRFTDWSVVMDIYYSSFDDVCLICHPEFQSFGESIDFHCFSLAYGPVDHAASSMMKDSATSYWKFLCRHCQLSWRLKKAALIDVVEDWGFDWSELVL